MSSELEIYNMAIARMGEKVVESIDEDRKAARLCNYFYGQTRDEVLRSHLWNFATKRIELTRLVDVPDFKYAFAYKLPIDFIRAVNINGYSVWDSTTIFEIEEGGILTTNAKEVFIKYIFREENSGNFDPLFTEALYLKLASKIAMAITGEPGIGQGFLQEYESVTAPLAQLVDATENRPTLDFQPDESRLAMVRSSILSGTSYDINSRGEVSTGGSGSSVIIGGGGSGGSSTTTQQDIVKQWGILGKVFITTGLKQSYIISPVTGSLKSYQVFSDVVGDVEIDVWKENYSGFPASVADSITGTNKIKLSSSAKGRDDVLTNWAVPVNYGDKLLFNIDSIIGLKMVVVELYFKSA